MEWLTNWSLTAVLVGLCMILIARPMIHREKLFELPFLLGAIVLVFILPQLPGLIEDRHLPAGGYAKTLIFLIICLLTCWRGWAVTRAPFDGLCWQLDRPTLVVGAAVMSLIGSAFYYQLSQQSGEMMVASGLTGLPVMQIFFSRFLVYGLGVAVLCFAGRPSWPTAVIIGFDAMFYLHRVVITGKRGEAFEFVILVALAFWFQRRRILLPRTAIIAGLALGFVAMASTGVYRDITRSGQQISPSSVLEIDLVGNFVRGLEQGGPEMRNSIHLISRADHTMTFDYGLFNWNVLVFNFVPAQVLGKTLKNSLTIHIPGLEDRNYSPPFGTTETGMADAFVSFWYFGFIKFLIIAYLLARTYQTAIFGHPFAQLIYMFSAVPAMHTISHHTQWLFSAWVAMALFLLPFVLLARRHGGVRGQRVRSRSPVGTAP